VNSASVGFGYTDPPSAFRHLSTKLCFASAKPPLLSVAPWKRKARRAPEAAGFSLTVQPVGGGVRRAQGVRERDPGGQTRVAPPSSSADVGEKNSGEAATFRSGAWEKGHVRGAKLSVGGNQVVGARLAAVPDPAGGATIDAEARTAIASILARLRQHGLIAP
jgi:hypothetical protein